MKRIITTIAAVVVTVCLFAQAPQKMSYQAVIRDADHVLVTNQTVGMQISILQGSVEGTVVYTETQTPTTNANGLVTIEIGEGKGFDAINWIKGPYFIKTETDPKGGENYTISGTSQLLSVPYALHAKTVTSYPETDPVFVSHPTNGITGANISNWNIAYSWGNHAGLYRLNSWVPSWTDITGKPNFATVATSGNYTDLSNKPTILNSQWTTSGSNIYYNSGNVGIGTITPSSKLEVNGQVKITGGTPASGEVLTSDGTGLASWEPIPVASVNQIYFEVKRDASYDWPMIGSVNKVDFNSNSTVWKNQGNAFDATTSTFTAPENGIYSFKGAICFSNITPGYFIYAFLSAGNKNYLGDYKDASGDFEIVNVSITLYLSKYQTAQLWGNVSDPTPPASVYGNAAEIYAFTYFSGAKVH